MNQVMSPDNDHVVIFRNWDTRQTPRKWLFVDMRMMKNSGRQDCAIFVNYFPSVRVVIPPCVFMKHRDIKIKGFFTTLFDNHIHHISFSSKGGNAKEEQK